MIGIINFSSIAIVVVVLWIMADSLWPHDDDRSPSISVLRQSVGSVEDDIAWKNIAILSSHDILMQNCQCEVGITKQPIFKLIYFGWISSCYSTLYQINIMTLIQGVLGRYYTLNFQFWLIIKLWWLKSQGVIYFGHPV